MSRFSTMATSTFTPALNVRSTTLPDSRFLSLVRTKAPPLPGFTCWNSTTFQRSPSRSRVMPFFRSFVVATPVSPFRYEYRSDLEQLACRHRQQLRPVRTDDDSVLDADTAPTGQVDAGLDRHRHALDEGIRGRRTECRSFVDLQTDAV